MADNIQLDLGSGGAILAADDISTVWYQRIKITDGTADSTTPIASGNGTSTNALRVTVSSDTTGVLSVDDNGANLSIDFGGTAPTLNTGAVDAGTLRVTVATGDTVTVDNAGTFATQVDGDALTSLQKIDNIAHNGSDVALVDHVPISGQFDDTATTSVTENQIAPIRITSGRALHVAQQGTATVSGTVTADAGTGPWPVTDNGGAITVDWAGTAPPIGAGVEATALRVTVATDSTGVLSVDDNGGSLTVDAANDSSLNVTVGDGTNTATIRNLAANDALNVSIVDGSGDQITTFGGGTQYTEDDVAPASPTGTAPVLVREDAPTSQAADGDWVAQRSTAYGAGYVQIVTSTGSFVDSFGGAGGTSHTDDAAFSIGSASSITPMGALADDTAPDSVDEGDAGLVRMTTSRILLTRLVGATDANRADVDGSGRLQVDIAADSVGIGGGTQYTEDDASAANPVGNQLIGRRRDSLSSETTADGDVVALNATDNGELYVKHVDAIPVTDNGGALTVDWAGTAPPIGAGTEAAALRVTVATDSTGVLTVDGTVTANAGTNLNTSALALETGGNLATVAGAVSGTEMQVDVVAELPAGTNNIGDVDVLSIVPGTAATNLGKAADAAAGSTDTGVALLGVRDDEKATIGTDGDYVQLRADEFGSLKTTEIPDATSAVQDAIIDAASSGNNTLVAAAGVGLKIRVLSAFLVSAGTVNVRFEDGAGGTALTGQMNLVANSGFVLPYNPKGWFETADNTLLNLELSAAISVDGCLTYVEI